MGADEVGTLQALTAHRHELIVPSIAAHSNYWTQRHRLTNKGRILDWETDEKPFPPSRLPTEAASCDRIMRFARSLLPRRFR